MRTHLFVKSFITELETITVKASAINQAATPVNLSIQGARTSVPLSHATKRRSSWILPSTDSVKIKVDAAVSVEAGVGVVAAVCRDHTSLYLISLALVPDGFSDPKILETIAIREGQCLADDLYKRDVIISCDCKLVVEEIQRSEGGTNFAIIKEIMGRRSLVATYSFIFESHFSNLDSHNLAKLSLFFTSGSSLVAYKPS